MLSLLRKSIPSVLLGALLAAGGSVGAYSQSQSINGTIRGTVTDATGAAVVGATVTVTNIDTGFTRQFQTSSDGIYVAPNLPIGTYSVQSQFTGFSPLTQTGIHLDAGSSATVDEQLQPGNVAQEVQVTGDAPILEASRFDLSRTISAAETQNLPLTSRNPYNFILFQPAVSGHPNQENGIPRVLNTNGLVDRVNFQLDGMVDTETDRYGLRLFAISDSYVKEIQSISNSYAPEFGNTAGIIFNTITNSGTNHFHGEAQYIWRPKAASSCPILNNCDPTVPGGTVKPSLHVDDFVGNVGGPVIKDKFFFFVAYEHLKRANPTATGISPATQATLIQNGATTAADFQTAGQVQYAQWFDVRGDWNINKKNQMFVRYNYFRNRYPFNTAVGGFNAISAAADFQDRAHIIGAQLVTTLSPNLLNEFRGSWPYRNEHHVADPLTGAGPQINIPSVAIFGGSTGVADKYQEKIPSFNDNVTYIHGAHSMKFGFGFQKNNDTQLGDVYTQYTFSSITAYLAAKNGTAPFGYSSLTASIGQPGAAYHSVFLDLFAQDAWQVRKNLLVSYGLRWDEYRAPAYPATEPYRVAVAAAGGNSTAFRVPMANFAPRLGISYQPFTRTVVRVSAGMFYEATPTNTWYNALFNNGAAGTGSFIYSIAGSATPGHCQPSFPNGPQNIPSDCIATQSIYAISPNFKNGYTWNGNLQVAQQLAKNDSLTVGYIMTNGRNMQFLRNSNLINPTSFLADGRPVFNTADVCASPGVTPTRQYCQFNNITLEDTGSNSSFNAMTVTYDHRQAGGLTSSISYTWSHSISDTPEGNTFDFSNTVEDPTNPKRDHGNSSVNRPNSLTASVVYEPNTHFENRFVNGAVHGNNFAFLANMSSGDQQSITVTPKLNGDSTVTTNRPLFVGRNTVRTPPIYQFDLRYTRTLGTYFDNRISPKLLIEGNNLFNRSNVYSINSTATVQTTPGGPFPIGTVITPPTYVKTPSLLEARILQFGLKIDF